VRVGADEGVGVRLALIGVGEDHAREILEVDLVDDARLRGNVSERFMAWHRAGQAQALPMTRDPVRARTRRRGRRRKEAMSAESNIKTIYGAFGRGDVPAILEPLRGQREVGRRKPLEREPRGAVA
jgi:hypothetical protein